MVLQTFFFLVKNGLADLVAKKVPYFDILFDANVCNLNSPW